MSRALLLLFPLLQVYIVIGTSCQFNYEVDCNNPYSANAWVTFVDPDYVASVTFHWGQENTDIGPQEYSSTSSQTYVGDFFNFGKVGEFNVGATVTYGEGSSCNGQVIRRNQTIWFEESACGLSGEGEGTDAPTMSPVVDNIVTTPRPTPSEIELSTFRPTPSEVEVSVFRIVACISVIHRSFSHQRLVSTFHLAFSVTDINCSANISIDIRWFHINQLADIEVIIAAFQQTNQQAGTDHPITVKTYNNKNTVYSARSSNCCAIIIERRQCESYLKV